MANRRRILIAASIATLAVATVPILRAAPTTAKGYLIAEMTVTDPDTFKQYAAASTTVMTQFGGKYVVRGGQTVAEEGVPPGDRFVEIEFENLDAARAFYDSAAYKAVAPMRMKSAHRRVFLIEGPPLL
jgi:uncharacterized protein (DUF1330 family)